ncbi:MAG: nitroreductase family deazaflavin-dependent oxidoreductase [Anaerolineales bacterium]|nr:nitroreductase family deazaflavin-dependent oxidoreductase [Anaerolineales bacterium]MCW5855972.1 nitroreductase family deazaflavin-dependent oxidoreductase [Anaerolineales bacterium]
MSPPEPIYSSPGHWLVRLHMLAYLKSGGRLGHKLGGTRSLLLTTRGRTSGKLFRTALLYGQDAGRYVIVASRGGHPQHPNWFSNLRQDPTVQVQVGTEVFEAAARIAQGAERERLWALMAAIWPRYNTYQANTQRTIPVVVLERSG